MSLFVSVCWLLWTLLLYLSFYCSSLLPTSGLYTQHSALLLISQSIHLARKFPPPILTLPPLSFPLLLALTLSSFFLSSMWWQAIFRFYWLSIPDSIIASPFGVYFLMAGNDHSLMASFNFKNDWSELLVVLLVSACCRGTSVKARVAFTRLLVWLCDCARHFSPICYTHM